jgi:hypothetical protein
MRRQALESTVLVILLSLLNASCTLVTPFSSSASPTPTCAPVSPPTASPPTSGILVSGIVRSAGSCSGVSAVRITAYEGQSGANILFPTEVVKTDASGLFEMRLPTGSYRVLFSPPVGSGLGPQWWLREKTYSRARTISASQGSIDVLLGRGFTIGGVVTDSGNVPLDGGSMSVSPGSPAPTEYDLVTVGGIDDQGRFSIMIAPGLYRLKFYGLAPIVSGWWRDRATFGEADDVVASRDVIDLRVTLGTGSTIRGRLTLASGEPASGAYPVAAHATTQGWCCEFETAAAETDKDGNFTMYVRDGTYRVGFVVQTAPRTVIYWWPSATSYENAGAVEVRGDRRGVDMRLPR